MSAPRMSRYCRSCRGNTRRAMTLYRENLKLSQELFTIVGCFEVALRNAIDRHYSYKFGFEWLRQSVERGGMFDQPSCKGTADLIKYNYSTLKERYSPSKLVSSMAFGFWRYLFAKPQFKAGGQSLLQIFPGKPSTTSSKQFNHPYVYNELAKINSLRNRIAHHEPICFERTTPIIGIKYAFMNYLLILNLLRWMNIKPSELFVWP